MIMARPTHMLITNAKVIDAAEIAIMARTRAILRLTPMKHRAPPTASVVGTTMITVTGNGNMSMLPIITPFESCQRLSGDALIDVELPEADHHGRAMEIKATKPAIAERLILRSSGDTVFRLAPQN